MRINDPAILAEVTTAFRRYEVALCGNDVATLDELFLVSPETIRYGATENLYGSDEVAAFRAARPSQGLERQLSRTVITTYGDNFAIASTLFHRASAPGKIGRQMQSWVRMPEGWRVVAAHVSLIDGRAECSGGQRQPIGIAPGPGPRAEPGRWPERFRLTRAIPAFSERCRSDEPRLGRRRRPCRMPPQREADGRSFNGSHGPATHSARNLRSRRAERLEF